MTVTTSDGKPAMLLTEEEALEIYRQLRRHFAKKKVRRSIAR